MKRNMRDFLKDGDMHTLPAGEGSSDDEGDSSVQSK